MIMNVIIIQMIFWKNRHNYIWLSSKELSTLILGNKIQFIWGVFLAFQNLLSELEIMSCDSRMLYIKSKEDSHINNFLLKFPETKELWDNQIYSLNFNDY